ncbi:MAG: efflux transporter outer membrane subunit [Nitrospirales bacterium]|nr:efflux transporter outer membrane subunit [Nitrospira sp.]MDR4500604.1 efflux transporter outer membrane subunit [Nitrospirales bacterium]
MMPYTLRVIVVDWRHSVRFVRYVLAWVLLSLSGCLVGPDYRPPSVDVPSDWNVMTLNGDSTAVPISSHAVPDAAWWQAFENEELSRFITLAVENNHDLRQASFRVMEGRALTIAAGAGLYPQVNVNGSYSRNRRSETILVGPTGGAPEGFAPPGANFDVWNALLDLRWELDLWGRIRRGLEAVEAEAEALEMERRGIVLTLISDVGESYFRLRELDEQIEIAETNLALRQDSLNLLLTRAEAGLISDLDVRRAEILVAESAAQIPELRRQRAAQVHHLEVLTGSPPDALALPRKPLRDVVTQPEIPVGLPADLLARRPDIVQVEHSLMAANARIGEARAYFFPSLSITGNGGFQTSEFDRWFNWASRSMAIGPSITLPIFLGKTNVARLEIAEVRYEQMLQQYHQTILNAFREVSDLLVALQTRAEQLKYQGRQVAAAQDARALAEIRYRKGLVTYLDVLDAQRSVLTAEQSLVSTERARLTEMVALFKAVGGGWDVGEPRGMARRN